MVGAEGELVEMDPGAIAELAADVLGSDFL